MGGVNGRRRKFLQLIGTFSLGILTMRFIDFVSAYSKAERKHETAIIAGDYIGVPRGDDDPAGAPIGAVYFHNLTKSLRVRTE